MNWRNIKLISLDLDGTLLNSERKVPERNKRAIQYAKEKGIEIIISTGSPYDLMPHEEIKELGISYVITANGSAIYGYPSRKCIYEESIDAITITPILEFLLTKDMHIDLFMQGRGYCPSHTRAIVNKLNVSNARKEYILNNRIWLENPVEYIIKNDLDIQKVTMNFYPDGSGNLVDRTEVKKYLEKCHCVNMVSGGWGNLEITKSGVSKGKALEILCKKLDISLTETAAFGDSLNDLDIIKAAGNGIAMENAALEVKDVADYVTGTNDACGIAEFIERLLKLTKGIKSTKMEIYKTENEKYILFGTGLTGMAIKQYYGADKILAAVDNDPQKIGDSYQGIPVISFNEYIEKYRDIPIIISVYSKHYFKGINQLKKYGVKNYFTSPPVIYGMETPEEFAENNKLKESIHVVFYGDNPITKRIEAYIREKEDIKIDYIDNGLCKLEGKKSLIRIEDLRKEDTLVLTTNEIENPIRITLKGRFEGKIVDLYQSQEQKKQKYRGIKKYKNIYKDRRCFIIGNGPSLRESDLTILERNREISFAANGIFHIFDKTLWRPTHYMVCDAVAYKEMYQDIKMFENENAFIADFYYADFEKLQHANRYYLINKIYADDEFGFSEDAEIGFYSGKTVTYVMLQMACYMGAKEIYLLGVDWTGGKGTGIGRIDFYENAENQEKNNRVFDNIMQEKYAYETARRYAESHEIKIYNATRGGELEVFERVDFDSLFDK